MNRAPGTIWALRLPGVYPNGHVMTEDDDQLEVAYYDGLYEGVIHLPRKEARLLAKRINQCLDRTAKR